MAACPSELLAAMMKLIVLLFAALLAGAVQAAPAAGPATDAAAPKDPTPRLAYGFLMKHGDKLVFAPCRERSYALVEDVSADRQVTRGLDMVGVADGRKYYVELLAVVDGNSLRASELNLVHAEGRCQKPGGPDEAWLARGNEPAWALSAGGDTVTLQRQDGPSVSVPYRVFERQEAVARFRGDGPDGALEVRFERQLCRDTMADAVFGWTATVRAGAQTLKGCALVR